MRAASLVLLALAGPAAAQGVPTNPFASNLPSYPRPHAEPAQPSRAERRAACTRAAITRGFTGRERRAFVRSCVAG